MLEQTSLVGQIWCVSLPSEFCLPCSPLGGLAHVPYSLAGTGRSARGMTSWFALLSLKGFRISGLTGNASV